MGRGVNWSQISNRKRMHRQGIEDIKGKTPLVRDRPPKQLRRYSSSVGLEVNVSRSLVHRPVSTAQRMPSGNTARSGMKAKPLVPAGLAALLFRVIAL